MYDLYNIYDIYTYDVFSQFRAYSLNLEYAIKVNNSISDQFFNYL